ncbi:MAG: DNA gyrase C-terminal beta-propeller domain-containing protein [Kiritimatiellia bacterium]|nr:DNA gyrase C-terminal beta-propeller domain-containing protein [Kiritimatiellia bacterium]
MRLYQLTGLERDKLEAEYLDVIKLISYLRDLLATRNKIYGLIKEELLQIRETYGDNRRTEIAPEEGEMNIEDLIADRSCIITISHTGYIKRVPTATYRAQRRGGKGVTGMDTKEEDFVEHLFNASTHDYVLFFTAGGRIYWEKVYEIPEAGRAARGKAIVNLLELKGDEQIAAMVTVRDFPENEFLVMATAKGIVKKTSLAEFKNPRRDGIIAINIEEGDQLIGVKLTKGQNDIMLATRNGMSLRFSETELRDQGRDTIGVRGIKLSGDDVVETIAIVDDKAIFFICTENGYGKRTSFEEYRDQHRAGKGIMAIRASDRNGKVVGAHAVMENDALMLITAQGQTIKIKVSDIRVISRVTQGVRLINLDKGDSLVSVTTVEPDEDELNGQPVNSNGPAGNQTEKQSPENQAGSQPKAPKGKTDPATE